LDFRVGRHGWLQRSLPDGVVRGKGVSIMRKLLTTVTGSVAVALLFSAPASAQYVYGPPPIAFNQAQPIVPGMPLVPPDDLFNKPPVRTPLGSIVGNFLRTEIHDGERPVGIVTLKENKTVAVPLEHLRFYPATGEVLTDLTWQEIATIPSGIRLRDSRCYPFGCPTAG
jgi:hypothetical protein